MRATSSSPSSSPFATSAYPSSPPSSSYTAPSSEIEDEEYQEPPKEEIDNVQSTVTEVESNETEGRIQRLQELLEKSSVFSSILRSRMETNRLKNAALTEDDLQTGQKRPQTSDGESPRKKSKLSEKVCAAGADPAGEDPMEMHIPQPPLVTGAKLRDYQLAGVSWMASLWENGLNGILADEMGLGKTLQTIAFLAYLKGRDVWGPFLIVCPLSVLHNWVSEFEKFAPSIPVCMYHGTPQERADLRATALQLPVDLDDDDTANPSNRKGRGRVKKRKTKSSGKVKSSLTRTGPVQTKASFPVVITTYELIIKDSQYLGEHFWKFIVVDEGHRLKNMDCKLIQEIKKYPSANRMILTGTPLHNNLAELWSLLNFILPDIFDDLQAFQEWFDLPTTLADPTLASHSPTIVTHLHGILKPFLLRRLKTDVETSLPPKKEYVLYAPLTSAQRDIYDAALQGGLRQYLIKKKIGPSEPVNDETASSGKKLRRASYKASYLVEDDDDVYFDDLENGHLVNNEHPQLQTLETELQQRSAVKQVNNLKLQNVIMQLRKVSSHPFLFDWPIDRRTREPILNEALVEASGKMLLLNRLLDALFDRGHRVLLFSQFTTMLDIIEDWATELKKWQICRIDGQTSLQDRQDQMRLFNSSTGSPDEIKLFLLSTRAGGLGLNLVAADTVIFYDQDWNPQMDLQAQDRAHRIGQTRPVLVFRLVTAHTVETTIMQKASHKRKLEALVIAKGKFRRPAGQGRGKVESIAEIAASLLKLEGEQIDIVSKDDKVISDEDLEVLLDRSPEVFSGRAKGWARKAVKNNVKGGRKSKQQNGLAFEVFEQETDGDNVGLTGLMGDAVQ